MKEIFLDWTARPCTDRRAGRATVALRYTVSYRACKDVQDDQSACNFFFLVLYWNCNFTAFSCALKFHGNTTGFTQEKRRKHFFFIRVDIRSKLAGVRCLCAISYSACCKGLAFHCLLMSELMFGLKDMTGGARTVRGIDAILAKKKKHEQRIWTSTF